MKAAPDKIYLNKYMFKTGMLYKSQYPVTPDIEYIRKDALLEIIKEESKFWDDGEMIFSSLIDKINSM